MKLGGYILAGLILLGLSACSRAGSSSQEDALLKDAVSAIGAESASAGYSAELCQVSQEHLDYMIAQGKISHDNFPSRSDSIESRGGKKSGEIVASNCGQDTVDAAAKQCAKSWDESPGHRVLMRQTWDTACYQMKPGATGCYYCIGLFANGIKN